MSASQRLFAALIALFAGTASWKAGRRLVAQVSSGNSCSMTAHSYAPAFEPRLNGCVGPHHVNAGFRL